MTTAYSTLMGLAEPVQGELAGTWGDTVNKGITEYLDIALAGTQTISGSQTAVTLSLTNGNASATNIAQAGSGSTGSAQYAMINCTGNPAGTLTVTVPASSRQYIVLNATSTSQSVKIVGVGPTTGVTIVSGEKALVAWNGSDYIKIATSTATGDVTAAGNNAFTGANTFYNGTGQTFGTATAAQDGLILAGRAGGTSTYRITLTPATLSSSTTLTLPNVTDTVATIGTAQTFTAAQTFRAANAIRSEAASTQDAIVVAGRAGGTSSYAITLTPATLSSSTTLTLPNSTSTVAVLGLAQSFTATQTFKGLTDTVFTITDGAAFEIDPANGSIQIVTLGASRTPAATNFAAGQSVLLGIDDGSAYTITWSTVNPTWVKPGGTASAPTLATSGYTWVLFWKVSTTIYASVVGSP